MNSTHDPRYQRLIKEMVHARHTAGLTQAQVTQTLRWRRTMLSQIETCQRRADLLEVHALTKLYRVKFQTLEAILDERA